MFESSNSFKTPRSDVDCLRQANKDLVETVKSLMSKNEALQARNVEISEQNDALKSQVEEVSAVNERLSEINSGNDKMISELHESLHDENSELVREIEEMSKMLTIEKETVRESEKFLEEVTAQMTTMIADQKKNFEEVIADLRTSHNEAKKALDKALTDVAHKSKLLDDKSAENVVLSEQIHTTENEIDVLKTENQALNDELRESQSDSDGLKVTIQELLSSNKENITQMTILEEELTAKNNVISGMTVDTHHISALLNEKTAENVDLAEQLSQAKAKTAELEADVQALVVSNNEKLASFQVNYFDKLDDVTNELDAMVEQNKSLQVRVEEVSSVNCATEEKNTQLAKELERLESLLTNEMASHNTTKKMLDSAARTSEEAVDNVKAQTAAQKVMETNIADLTRTVDRAKKSLDQALADARNKNILLQEKTGEISDLKYKISRLEALTEQHHISNDDKDDMIIAVKVESDELKSIVENLRSKNTEYATEIENLTSSMQEMVERNETLQARVEDIIAANVKLTHANHVNEKKSLEDETAKQQELEETKKMLEVERKNNVAIIEKSQETLEAVTAEMSAMMSDQAAAFEENIAALGKSLNEVKSSLGEALIDINRKNSLLQTKSAEVVNLTEQLEVHRVKIDELTIEVQALVAIKEEITQQKATLQSDMAALLENDFVAKNIMIDQLKTDVDAWEFTCKEKTAEIADLTEQLQLSMTKSDGLNADVQSAVASNEGFAHQVSELKDVLAAKELIIDETAMSLEEKSEEIVNLDGQLALSRRMIDGMSIDIQGKISLLEEKSAEIADLTERLQLNNVDCDELKTEVKSLNDINKENSNQISLLDVELAAKRNTIDQMTAEIELKSFALEEKITEITYITEQLELSKDKVEAIVIINEANAQKITMLEDDLANKTFVIDKISEDIQQKDMMLDGKTLDILNLTEQLQLSKTESDELKKDVKSLLTSNEDIAHQVSELKDDLVAKEIMINETAMSLEEKSEEIADLSKQLQISMAEKYGLKTEVEALVTSHKEIVQKMTMLGDELVEKSTMIDKMSDHIQRKSTSLEEKSSEINDLKDQLKLSKAERDELLTEVEALIASKTDIIQQKSSLENDVVAPLESDLAAKNFIIDMMNTDIQRWETTCKEKTAEISDLNEKVQILKVDKDGLKKDIKSLVVINKENRQQLSNLEKDLVAKKILIDEMTLNVQQKNILLEERLEENTDLSERLEKSNAETDGLKKEVDDLTSQNADNLKQISSLEQNLAANKIALDKMREEIQHKTALIEEKADEVIDFTEQVKLLKAESSTLKMEVEALLASKEKISKQMSLMEGDLADKTIAFDEMSEDIQYKNMLLDGKTAEIAHLTEHIETSKNKSDELKSKIEVMISMHKEDVRRISELEDDLLAKTTMMSDDIQKKNISFEEKLSEIADLTEQLKLSKAENDRLKTEVESLIAINKQNSLEISALEDDFATKKGMIDEMITYINKCNANCEEMAAETTAQNKKLALSQQECDVLKVTVCDLESLISTKSSEIENLLISVCDVNRENEKLQAQIKQAYASIEVLDLSMKKMLTLEKEEKAAIVRKSEETIEEIKIKLSTVSGQKEALEEEVSNLSKSLVEMSFNSNQAKLSLEDKTAELTDLTEQLKLSISKNEELDLDVKTLVVSNSEKVQAIADLTKTIASQETVIEELSDVKNVNAALNEQVEVLTAESHILKTTIEYLETKSHKDTNGLKELESCLQETVEKNEFLQAQVEEVSATNDQLIKINEANEEKIADSVDAVGRMTKSFKDDLAAKKVMIDELSKMLDKEKEFSVAVVKKLEDTLEVVTTQITDQMSAQKESEVTICNLTKSLEDAQVDNNNKTLELEKKTAENVELSDRLQQSKTKFYELKSDVETLIARNKENLQVISDLEDDVASKKCTIDDLTKAIGKYTGEIEHLKSCLQETVNTKDELHDMTEQLSSANEKLGKVNIAYEGKNAILLDTIERLEELLNNERSSHKMEKANNVTTVQNLEDTITNVKVQMSEQKRLLEGSLSDAMALLDEKTAENIAVGEKLQLLTAKFDTEVTAKQTMIDEMSIDANKRNSAYEELVATNAALNEQYELSEAECAQLKTTIECLESKINTNANELEKLTSSFQEVVETCDEMAEENNALNEHLCQSKASLQEVVDQNKALLLQVDELGMTKDKLNDEKAYLTEMLEVEKENNATIIQDLKETLKAEKTQMTNQISAQKESLHKSISDLGKSLDEAMGLLDEKIAENLKLAELIENKDKELCENTLEVNNLAEQLKLSKKESSDTIKMLKKEHKSRIFELKAAVQDLVSSTTMKNQHIKAMEEAKAVTKIMIDGLSEDIKNRDARCEEMAKEITLLSERLELAKTECTDLGLKHTSQASEIETLMSSLQEMVDLNCSLQTQVESAYVSIEELHEVSNANEEENKVLSSVVERVSQQLKDEKTRHERELKQLAKKLGSSHGREIEEMKKRLAAEKENNSIVVRHLTETLEDATTQLTLQMSVKQRSLDASIADLARFLDE